MTKTLLTRLTRFSRIFSAAALLCGCLAGRDAFSQLPAADIPDLVQAPHGIDRGNTSFYDGFSTLDPGFTLLGYFRFDHSTSITNNSGGNSTSFVKPEIDTSTEVAQLVWSSHYHMRGHATGFEMILPLTSFGTSYGSGGNTLKNNGTRLGDITFGPLIQFRPIMTNHHPFGSVRMAFDVIAPTGGFNSSKDVNQSSGYWSLTPYVSYTVLPSAKWETSGRLTYIYNFSTTKIPDPPTISGFTFKDGQAGQLFDWNFDASYKVAKKVAIGGNGYTLLQFTNDQINSTSLPSSQRKSLYLGPGLHWDLMPKAMINFNVYLPVTTRNLDTGPEFNLQIIHPF